MWKAKLNLQKNIYKVPVAQGREEFLKTWKAQTTQGKNGELDYN